MAKKIPDINPFAAPFAFCSNRGCGKLLKPILKTEKGERMITYTCDDCGYYCEVSPSYLNGQCRPIGVTHSLPEAIAK